MEGRITYSMRLSVLALYCIYAVSPIYLSAVAGRNDWITECGQQDKNVTLGIVWVNVLLSKIAGTEQCAAATPLEVRTAGREREFLLIRKKRAVLRETFRVRPLLIKQAEASIIDVPPAMLSFVYKAPPRPQYRYADFSIFSHAGLSPPQPFA